MANADSMMLLVLFCCVVLTSKVTSRLFSAVVTGTVKAIWSSTHELGKVSLLHVFHAAVKSLGRLSLSTKVHFLCHLSISSLEFVGQLVTDHSHMAWPALQYVSHTHPNRVWQMDEKM